MKVTDIQGEADYNDICQIVLHRTGESHELIASIVHEFFNVVAEALAIHDRVELHGIGVFKLEHRAPRKGKTPDGVEWETPERWEIAFHASEAYATKVDQFSGE